MKVVIRVPGGLVDGQRRPRRLQVNGGGPWFLAALGRFERVGAGDLSLTDLVAVEAELGDGVFVALPLRRSLQEYLEANRPSPRSHRASTPAMGPVRRLQRYDQLRDNVPPTVNAVARAAQVAVLPNLGAVWVDGHHLFQPGERTPLPWTEPRVELTVVRPATVRSALREAIGRGGPRRAADADLD